jgi:endonuclease/exonuclease/phosphatase family metal-dependent hydrolase
VLSFLDVRRLLPLLVVVVVAVFACDEPAPAATAGPVTPPDAATPDAAGSVDGGLTRRPGVLRVATFNVHRFFDTVCESGNCAAGDFEEAPSQAFFDAQTEKLAKGIALIDPDVISLEEVETDRCLAALATKLAAMGKSFPIAHLGETGSAGSVDVAVLARGALGEIKTHRDTRIPLATGGTTTFSRELLEVHMTFGAKQVVMFAAHFRSQVADDPARRLAEAKAAQAIVAKASTDLPDALVLLGGDLNDKPGSDPINALEAGGALLRVASDLPADDQATYVFNGVKSALDHIFIGAPQASRYVAKSTTAYKDDPRGGFAGSDHAALAADFSIE